MTDGFADMLQDWSRRAHNVLFLARLRAGQRGAPAIEVEDFLVALLIEDQGGFFKALSDLPAHRNSVVQADFQLDHPSFLPPQLANELLQRVEALCTRSEPVPQSTDLPMGAGTKLVLNAAKDLSKELRQRRVEPLHFFAVIAADESTRCAQILRGAGITPEKVVKAIREQPTEASRQGSVIASSALTAPSTIYSQRVREVLFLARLKARARGAETIEIEDFLSALLVEDQVGFLDALSDFPGVGVDMTYVEPRPRRPFVAPTLANDLRARVEALCRRSQPLPPDAGIPMSANMKRMLAASGSLREGLGQREIEPLHLLAAIVADESSHASQLLREAGITREKVLEALRAGGPDVTL